MKNPFNIAPRCVQWAAAILLALPVFDLLVSLETIPADLLLLQWQTRFISTAIFLTIALGLVYGINIIRLIFATLAVFGSVMLIITSVTVGLRPIGTVYSFTSQVGPWIALVLCFVPAANPYFKRSPAARDLPEPTPEGDANAADLGNAPAPGTADPSVSDGGNITRNILFAAVALAVVWGGYLASNAHHLTTAYGARVAETILRNDARIITRSADQYFMENQEVVTVAFGLDANGGITGPLQAFGQRLSKGVRVASQTIDRGTGTFSLQHDAAFAGKPVVFDRTGEVYHPQAK